MSNNQRVISFSSLFLELIFGDVQFVSGAGDVQICILLGLVLIVMNFAIGQGSEKWSKDQLQPGSKDQLQLWSGRQLLLPPCPMKVLAGHGNSWWRSSVHPAWLDRKTMKSGCQHTSADESQGISMHRTSPHPNPTSWLCSAYVQVKMNVIGIPLHPNHNPTWSVVSACVCWQVNIRYWHPTPPLCV